MTVSSCLSSASAYLFDILLRHHVITPFMHRPLSASYSPSFPRHRALPLCFITIITMVVMFPRVSMRAGWALGWVAWWTGGRTAAGHVDKCLRCEF